MKIQEQGKLSPEIRLFLELIRRRVAFEYDSRELGDLAISILSLLLVRNEKLSDERIASLLNANPADVRRVLQFLYRVRLIETTKEAIDIERGRYDSKWCLSQEFIKKVVRERIKEVLDKIAHYVKEISSTMVYVCPICFKRYTIDEAYEYNFECPRDGASLIQPDTNAEINFLSNLIKKIEEYLEKSK